jgi:hypothetical protein
VRERTFSARFNPRPATEGRGSLVPSDGYLKRPGAVPAKHESGRCPDPHLDSRGHAPPSRIREMEYNPSAAGSQPVVFRARVQLNKWMLAALLNASDWRELG